MPQIILKISVFFAILLLTISCGQNQDTKQQKEEKIPYSVAKKMHKKELLEWNKNSVELDAELIRKYIQRRNWNMQVSETGLYYQIYHKTNDIKAQIGMKAVFNYKISFLDGTIIYTSDDFGQRSLLLGKNDEEFGLNEGLLMMRKGEKARFILPPHLAFGVPGDGFRVPYNAILVYEIELVDLINPKTVDQEKNDTVYGWI